MKPEYKVFAAAIFFGMFFWFSESVIDSLFFREGTLLDSLIFKIPSHDLHLRSISLALFLIFGLLMFRLVSKNQKVRNALLESEKFANSLINAPTDSVFLIDAEGIILKLNDTAAKVLGKSKIELLGKNISTLFAFEVAERRKEWYEAILRTGKSLRREDERDGIWFDTISYPILNETGKVSQIAILARNITDRKKVEEELENIFTDR